MRLCSGLSGAEVKAMTQRVLGNHESVEEAANALSLTHKAANWAALEDEMMDFVKGVLERTGSSEGEDHEES